MQSVLFDSMDTDTFLGFVLQSQRQFVTWVDMLTKSFCPYVEAAASDR